MNLKDDILRLYLETYDMERIVEGSQIITDFSGNPILVPSSDFLVLLTLMTSGIRWSRTGYCEAGSPISMFDSNPDKSRFDLLDLSTERYDLIIFNGPNAGVYLITTTHGSNEIECSNYSDTVIVGEDTGGLSGKDCTVAGNIKMTISGEEKMIELPEILLQMGPIETAAYLQTRIRSSDIPGSILSKLSVTYSGGPYVLYGFTDATSVVIEDGTSDAASVLKFNYPGNPACYVVGNVFIPYNGQHYMVMQRDMSTGLAPYYTWDGIRQRIDKFEELIDIDTCPVEYLNDLAWLFGRALRENQSIEVQRNLFKILMGIYKRKGVEFQVINFLLEMGATQARIKRPHKLIFYDSKYSLLSGPYVELVGIKKSEVTGYTLASSPDVFYDATGPFEAPSGSGPSRLLNDEGRWLRVYKFIRSGIWGQTDGVDTERFTDYITKGFEVEDEGRRVIRANVSGSLQAYRITKFLNECEVLCGDAGFGRDGYPVAPPDYPTGLSYAVYEVIGEYKIARVISTEEILVPSADFGNENNIFYEVYTPELDIHKLRSWDHYHAGVYEIWTDLSPIIWKEEYDEIHHLAGTRYILYVLAYLYDGVFPWVEDLGIYEDVAFRFGQVIEAEDLDVFDEVKYGIGLTDNGDPVGFYPSPIVTPWYAIADRWHSRVSYPADEGNFLWTESANLLTGLKYWTPPIFALKKVVKGIIKGPTLFDALLEPAPIFDILTANFGGVWNKFTETWIGGVTYIKDVDFRKNFTVPLVMSGPDPYDFTTATKEQRTLIFKLDRYTWIEVVFEPIIYTAPQAVDYINAVAALYDLEYSNCAALFMPNVFTINCYGRSGSPLFKRFVKVHPVYGNAILGIAASFYMEEIPLIEWIGATPAPGLTYNVVLSYVLHEFT